MLRRTIPASRVSAKWNGPAVLPPPSRCKLGGGVPDKEHAMSQKIESSIAVIGIVRFPEYPKSELIGNDQTVEFLRTHFFGFSREQSISISAGTLFTA